MPLNENTSSSKIGRGSMKRRAASPATRDGEFRRTRLESAASSAKGTGRQPTGPKRAAGILDSDGVDAQGIDALL